jgi:hypothetical protein
LFAGRARDLDSRAMLGSTSRGHTTISKLVCVCVCGVCVQQKARPQNKHPCGCYFRGQKAKLSKVDGVGKAATFGVLSRRVLGHEHGNPEAPEEDNSKAPGEDLSWRFFSEDPNRNENCVLDKGRLFLLPNSPPTPRQVSFTDF